MPSHNTNVFVSYSHADASLVAPVVKLLRVNKSLVFQDVDDIQPGKRWRSEIARGLAESHLVVVFWCDHASRSEEVSREWKAAIDQKKDLLPLLLDATPLPPELVEFQWIDFRGTVGHNHSSFASTVSEVSASAPRAVKSARWLSIAGVAASFVAVVGALSLFNTRDAQFPSSDTGPPDPTPLPPPPPPESFDLLLSNSVLLSLSLLLVVAACLVWLWRRRSTRRGTVEHHPSGEFDPRITTEIETEMQRRTVERRIATEIETEIRRRTALRQDAGA